MRGFVYVRPVFHFCFEVAVAQQQWHCDKPQGKPEFGHAKSGITDFGYCPARWVRQDPSSQHLWKE